MSDDWKASVDRQLSQLHGDVRLLTGALVAGFLFLLVAGGVCYVRLSDQINAVQTAVLRGETRDAELNGKLDILLERKQPGKAN